MECARAEAALAAARAKKEPVAKIASLTEEFLRLQRQVEVFSRAQEQLEWRKQAQAASDARAKKTAEVERLRSLRVLNTQNSLRQSWQQFIGNSPSKHNLYCFYSIIINSFLVRITRFVLRVFSRQCGLCSQKIKVSNNIRGGCARKVTNNI